MILLFLEKRTEGEVSAVLINFGSGKNYVRVGNERADDKIDH